MMLNHTDITGFIYSKLPVQMSVFYQMRMVFGQCFLVFLNLSNLFTTLALLFLAEH